MKLQEILEQYSDVTLDKISVDKVDEALNLRLPRAVIIQEIIAALSSLTYVANILAPTKPPTYTILKLLLDAPDYTIPIEGFKNKVLAATETIREKAASMKSLSSGKDFQLYLKMLKTAWEDDIVERSEALLLEALREELGIWTSEHLLLEHHPDINQLSNLSNSYLSERNRLLITGLILTYNNNYILAEEVAIQIRRVWGIELENNSYFRLLNVMTKTQLYTILEKSGLQVSGSKEEQIYRTINALVPPSIALGHLHIDELREICRENKIYVSGVKVEVTGNIIDHFDQGNDLVKDEDKKTQNNLPEEPEERELNDKMLTRLLQNISNDQLYDILSACYLKTSGNKEAKIKRLVESPWSDRTILGCLRRPELSNLCRKLAIQVTGVKSELIDRLIEWASLSMSVAAAAGIAENLRGELEVIEDYHYTDELDVSEMNYPEEKELPVPGLDVIKEDFPSLEPDEHIILALIKETKSLTEQDIERAAQRHGFEWFLTKAHMAELLAKLKTLGNLPLKVRSIRSVNVYEWIGTHQQNEDNLERRAARDVIDALRQGVVPEKNLELLVVGQEAARDHLVELLDEVQGNKSAFKFIRGPYGAGKTFLCSWLKQYALENEFVVSTINIGPDQPLSDLPVFFSGVINGLRTPEKRDSCALTDVLESWLLAIHRKTAQIEGLNAFDRTTKERLMPLVEARIESELSGLSSIEPCFSPALRAFYHANIVRDQVTASAAVAWLSGSRSMSAKSLSDIGVRGYLESNQVFPRMRALLEVIGGSRFKGLLLMVDELELVRKFPHARQREQALETLRLLIDETGKNGLPGCLLIFTGTDTFFDDDRTGLKSYEALDNRVAVPEGPNGFVSVRQPVIRLEGLNRDRLLSVVSKVRDIHGVAYTWNSADNVSDDFLNKIVQEWTSFGDESVARKPRPVLREFIHILDVCEENRGVNLDEFFGIPMGRSDIAREIDCIIQD